VLIDVPKDVQNQMVSFDLPTWWCPMRAPSFDIAAVEEAAKMIEAAERPVLYLGGGVIHSAPRRWP
jgi:acetolactate synthase-1/2/3 large subunit